MTNRNGVGMYPRLSIEAIYIHLASISRQLLIKKSIIRLQEKGRVCKCNLHENYIKLQGMEERAVRLKKAIRTMGIIRWHGTNGRKRLKRCEEIFIQIRKDKYYNPNNHIVGFRNWKPPTKEGDLE